MTKEFKIKGKFYPLKHDELISIAHANLTRFEILVLYYIRTLDPHNDGVEVSASKIAKDLSTKEKEVCRQTVSRALKRLDTEDYIDLEIVRAVVKLSGKGYLVSENTTGVCTHQAVSVHTKRCEETPSGVCTHQAVSVHTKRCEETPSGVRKHQAVSVHTTDIYKERARAQTLTDLDQTNSNCLQTEEDSTSTSKREFSDAIECEIVEPSKDSPFVEKQESASFQELAVVPEVECSEGVYVESERINVALLKEIEGLIHNPKSCPWRINSGQLKPQIAEAVYKCNPRWYSIEGTATPNTKKISDRIKSLERQLRKLDASAVEAYEELTQYWRLASNLDNPIAQMSPKQAKAAEIYTRLRQKYSKQEQS